MFVSTSKHMIRVRSDREHDLYALHLKRQDLKTQSESGALGICPLLVLIKLFKMRNYEWCGLKTRVYVVTTAILTQRVVWPQILSRTKVVSAVGSNQEAWLTLTI